MGKGRTTREAVVAEALRQATRLGLEGVSLGPLAGSLDLSKSGLFAHFRSKEALQHAVIQEAVARFEREVIAPSAGIADPEARLRAVFADYLAWIRGADGDGGCPFTTLVQEYDDRPGPLRDRLVEAQRAWRDVLAGLVRAGIRAGTFRTAADPGQATFEFCGAALAYQVALHLLDDPRADERAHAALDRLIDTLRA